ncbi:Thiol-specific monooxygenase [Meyerozyma sp. JA9]|nr:Thiol-specific monooxygenase [Meyerozyma sp. JA9]
MPIFEKGNEKPAHVKSVAIIGGGASGAIALDSLKKEDHFDSIVLFERRDILGGVWCLDNPGTLTEVAHVGRTPEQADPPLENPFRNSEAKGTILVPKTNQYRYLETPSYPNLKTNITESLMTFSDSNSWTGEPSDETEFVDGPVVRDYIEAYILRNKSEKNVSIEYSSTIEDVERIITDNGHYYKLTIRKSSSDSHDIWYQRNFDAIVVATGHYHVPFIPDVPGLREAQEKFPGLVKHAKYFRTPERYKDKVVVVVGTRASGIDISRLLVGKASKVYHSRRNSQAPALKNVVPKGVIKEFKIVENQVVVVFDDNSEVVAPDHIIYGTGYQFSYPFLNRLFAADNQVLTHDGVLVPGLYQHTFLINDPLITFVGIPIDGVSFRVFEYQAILVARFLAGRITLPNVSEQELWRNDRFSKKGPSRSYHTIGADDASDYMLELTRLGYLDKSLVVGRQFPEFSKEDLDKYLSAQSRVFALWNIF